MGVNFYLVSRPVEYSAGNNLTYVQHSAGRSHHLMLVLDLTKEPLSTAMMIGLTLSSQRKFGAKQNAGLFALCEFAVAHQLR